MSGLPLDALFEALANGLWRGSLLVIVAALLLRFVKPTTAAERYAAWLAVLAVIALAPLTETLLSWARPAAPPLEMTAMAPIVAQAALPAPVEAPPEGPAMSLSAGPFLWLWSLVGLALAVRLSRRCALAARLKREALPPDTELTAALEQWESRLTARRVGSTRIAKSLRSPAAVGWLDPAVLLPGDSQQSADLEMLWRHEQAHVARRDDWTQLFAECLFALAWFHPAAHWVRRQLERERELACDEAVVNSGVEAGRYAGALGRWAERAAANDLPLGVMGLGRSRALVIRRIEMLLSPTRIHRRHGGRWAFGGSLAAAWGASFLLAVSGPLVIRAQTAAEPIALDVEVEVQPVVDIAVPVTPVVPDVHVEPVVPHVQVDPVLVSQVAPPAPPVPPAPIAAPAPMAPSAPIAAPAPMAAPVPAPPVPPVATAAERGEWAKAMAERAQRWREEMQPQLEAIQREASRIQEVVRAQMGPQQEKLRGLARAMAKEHAKSIQPLAKEMAALGAQMSQASEAQRKELAAKMEALSKRMAEQEPELRRLGEEMSKIEIDMRPFEERMKELEKGLREKQKAFEESAQPSPQ